MVHLELFPEEKNDYITDFNLSSTYSGITCYNFTSLNVYRVALMYLGNFISYLALFVHYFTTLKISRHKLGDSLDSNYGVQMLFKTHPNFQHTHGEKDSFSIS